VKAMFSVQTTRLHEITDF